MGARIRLIKALGGGWNPSWADDSSIRSTSPIRLDSSVEASTLSSGASNGRHLFQRHAESPSDLRDHARGYRPTLESKIKALKIKKNRFKPDKIFIFS